MLGADVGGKKSRGNEYPLDKYWVLEIECHVE